MRLKRIVATCLVLLGTWLGNSAISNATTGHVGVITIEMADTDATSPNWTVSIKLVHYSSFENGILQLRVRYADEDGFTDILEEEIWRGNGSSYDSFTVEHSFPAPAIPPPYEPGGIVLSAPFEATFLPYRDKRPISSSRLYIEVLDGRILSSHGSFRSIWGALVYDSLVKLGLGDKTLDELDSLAPELADSLRELNTYRARYQDLSPQPSERSPHPPGGNYDSAGWIYMGTLENLGPAYPGQAEVPDSGRVRGWQSYELPDSLKARRLIPIERPEDFHTRPRSDTLYRKNRKPTGDGRFLPDSSRLGQSRRDRGAAADTSDSLR